MATLIKGKKIVPSTTYEPKVIHLQGICKDTVEDLDPPFTLHYGIMPPSHRTRAHYHINGARGNYVVKGRIRYFFGPAHDQQIIDAEAGDFIYTARGEIHYQINLSDTDTAEFIGTYVGCDDRERSGKIFVEPPIE